MIKKETIMIKAEFKDLENFFQIEDRTKCDFNPEKLSFSDKDRLSDPIFRAIGYPSKIYYKNIQSFIKAYTQEGGVVIDSCSGSGSTGIAALLENRKCVLIDNSPHAVNMAFNIFNHVDLKSLDKVYKLMLKELEYEINDIYKTISKDGYCGYEEVIIASNVYSCPSCTNEIVLYKNETKRNRNLSCNDAGK
jgi:DNA modification methylase